MRTLFALPALLLFAQAFVDGHPFLNPNRNLLARRSLDPRIVGGRKAEDGEFPYQVSLRIYDQHACGASILDETHIITAAHCLFNFFGNPQPVSALSILAGTNTQATPGSDAQLRDLASYTVHENYKPDEYHDDVAVLVLKSPLELNDKVQPVKLTTSEPKSGDVCTVSGWGVLNEDSWDVPNDLYAVNLTIVSRGTCDELYEVDGYPGIIQNDMICSLQDNKDSCQGDSGGPMVCNQVLSGLVSFGDGCARPQIPGVYTNVAYFLDWVNSHL